MFIWLHTKTLQDQLHNFVLTSMQPHNLPFSLKFFVLIGIWWKMHFFFSINPGTITGIRRIVGVGHTLCNGITRKVTHRTINFRPDSSVKFSPLLLKMDKYTQDNINRSIFNMAILMILESVAIAIVNLLWNRPLYNITYPIPRLVKCFEKSPNQSSICLSKFRFLLK